MVCGKSFSVQDTLSTHVEAIGLPLPCTVQQHPFCFASHVGDAAINKQDNEMSFSNFNFVSDQVDSDDIFPLILSEDLAWPTQFQLLSILVQMKWHPMQLKVRRLLKTPFAR
jgi:hypothetical protein